MTEKEIINELDSIISYCDVTKEKATGLRRKLECGASPKRTKISDTEIAKIVSARRKFLNKKALRQQR